MNLAIEWGFEIRQADLRFNFSFASHVLYDVKQLLETHPPQVKSFLEHCGRHFQSRFLKEDFGKKLHTCSAVLPLGEHSWPRLKSTWDGYLIYTVPIKVVLPDIWG